MSKVLTLPKATKNSTPTLKKHYKIDEVYTHLSYLSLFDKCHQLIINNGYNHKTENDDNTFEVLEVFRNIDKALKHLDIEFKLGLFEAENDWFLNYLRSHYSFNLTMYNDETNIDNITYHLSNLIKASNGELHNEPLNLPKKTTSKLKINDNNFNFKLYKQMEVLNIQNKINYTKNEIMNMFTNSNIVKTDMLDLVNLCNKNIDLDLMDMIFDITEETYQNNPSYQELLAYARTTSQNDIQMNTGYNNSKINNTKILLYKVYMNMVKAHIISCYKEAAIKTIVHCEKLMSKDGVQNGFYIHSEQLEKYIKKYKTKGMPIDKFKTSTIDHIERIVGLVKKYS